MQKSSDEISSHLLGACFIYIKSSEHLIYSRAFSKGGTIMYIYIETLSINGGIAIAFFILAWLWYKSR